ncbi:MAG: DNA double-strand break repair nuclease NurA [Pyrinomonadaceae bacterium]|nr:DNA double-strand break repair nuclease NurA [Pyrinomonadaceae bacterium]
MLNTENLKDEFEAKSADFVDFSDSQKRDLEEYLRVLAEIIELGSVKTSERVATSENGGAIPSAEIDDQKEFRIEFGISWNNHEESREWAAGILGKRTTFAADGSQYYSEKDTSLPVGAVQIGWFENPHSGEADYEKNTELRILSPKELLENQEEPLKPESRVSEEMFVGEISRIADFISRKTGWEKRGEMMPLAFFDRPMLLPFAAAQDKLQKKFVQELVDLIRHSRDSRVPVVGYVDRGFSRDLVNLIIAFSENSAKPTLYDSSLLGTKSAKDRKILSDWGDRTPFCYSKRKGLESFTDPETEMPLVGFSFLQTSTDTLPSRLDIPSWVYEEGLLDEAVDVVRAECVIGVGYPYALETADQTAVFTFRDREIFLKALQEFAKKHNLDFSFSRKNRSKARRR